ncbi:integrase core domain protein [Oesophagostomum dentatum]|uniref:Integrase core domain protein n=1 Tax=Oesophagostomum dentatum TaxID=61180 RepID=A0A0B1TI66_OESDE|nr:integrase core domain protein [Oesophagostomum dentatum]
MNGKMFLVIVDAYSKWPEIIEMTSTTSLATIRDSTRLFAQFGNPETIVSDNGSQFASREFAEFCNSNGITHVRSPPFHPQSNGQAERFVDTFKRARSSKILAQRQQRSRGFCKRTAEHLVQRRRVDDPQPKTS